MCVLKIPALAILLHRVLESLGRQQWLHLRAGNCEEIRAADPAVVRL